MSKFTHHLFICSKCKPSKKFKDGRTHDPGKLRSALKKEIKRLGIKAEVRANDSGCLDMCDDGQIVVIYPQAIWYGRVAVEDAERIIQETVVGGKVLEDLKIPEDRLKCGKKSKSTSAIPAKETQSN